MTKIDNLPKKDEIEQMLKNEQKKTDRLWRYTQDPKIRLLNEKLEELKNLPQPETIFTGMGWLDSVLEGFEAGELVVVAGPTGEGKTTLLRTFTRLFSERELMTLWFSFEMSLIQLAKRFNVIPTTTVPDDEFKDLIWLEDRITEGVLKHDVKAVFIDHLHFLLSMKNLSEARSSSVYIGNIVREIKKLAIKTNTVIFLVSHITKSGHDDKPRLSDLRDSSFTAQEADIVLLIRRMRDEKTEEELEKAELSIAKNRRVGKKSNIRLIHKGGEFYED